jgi:hypothetical protein
MGVMELEGRPFHEMISFHYALKCCFMHHPFLHLISLATLQLWRVVMANTANGRINQITVVPGSVIRVTWQDKVTHLNEIPHASRDCPFSYLLACALLSCQ